MRTPTLISAAISSIALLTAPASSQCVEERIPNPPGGPTTFGSSSALDGDTLAVGQTHGTDGGVVYIYDRQGTDWVLTQEIPAITGFAGVQFGGEVALRGDTLLVAATGGGGTVFAYERVNGLFELDEELETSFPLQWGMNFGSTIVLDDDGNEAIITAPDASNVGFNGRFFHFRKQSAGWIEKQVVHPAFDNVQDVSLFRWSVLYDAPLLFIGNKRAETNTGNTEGEVYVYEFNSGFGFTKIQELRDGSSFSSFGASLAKRGNQLAVGAPWYWSNNIPRGAVVLFEDNGSGFQEVATVLPGVEHGNLQLGTNVEYHGNKLFIGSTRGGLADNQPWGGGGVVRVYQKVDDVWTYVARAGPHEGPTWIANQNFSKSGSDMVVSSRSTSAAGPEVWILDLDGGVMNLFCEAGENSVGAGAWISAKGFPSVSENLFSLVAEGAPPNQFGKFYYGPEPASLPFGNGTACVGTGTTGTFRLLPAATTDSDGNFERQVDFTEPPADAGAGQILPGSTWYFQYWYRDPQGGGAAFNPSDGLEVSFCP